MRLHNPFVILDIIGVEEINENMYLYLLVYIVLTISLFLIIRFVVNRYCFKDKKVTTEKNDVSDDEINGRM